MSIKIDSTTLPPSVRPAADKKSATGFEERLQTFLADQSPESRMAEQARLQMHMCQLQLARNLFEESDDGKFNDLFASLSAGGRPGLPDLPSWRKPDGFPTPGGSLTKTSAPPAAATEDRASGLESIIDRAATDYDVAPELIRSVIRVESAFNPRAVSPAGARGLMQLMPETAAELGVSNSFDPEQNVMAGTRYLRRLLDRYDGDLDHALAAYNWGMGNVDRHGLQAMPEETRNYLERVKRA